MTRRTGRFLIAACGCVAVALFAVVTYIVADSFRSSVTDVTHRLDRNGDFTPGTRFVLAHDAFVRKWDWIPKPLEDYRSGGLGLASPSTTNLDGMPRSIEAWESTADHYHLVVGVAKKGTILVFESMYEVKNMTDHFTIASAQVANGEFRGFRVDIRLLCRVSNDGLTIHQNPEFLKYIEPGATDNLDTAQ
jgi:hypothetical protein